MKKYAITCKFEHPIHSLILDIDDKMWVKDEYFTKKEMEEIKDARCAKDPELPTQLTEYLDSYIGKKDLESIFDHARHCLFHPKRESDLFWIQQSFVKALNLFYSNYLPITDHSETDILNHCFDVLDFEVRGGEKTSSASSEGKNASQSLSGEEGMNRKTVGKKVDLLFKSGSNEYGCAEAGKQMETETTKELSESRFICPKTLQDILMKLRETIYNFNPKSLPLQQQQ
ncbi:hypothetical protein BDC45DRAFT_529428 [Circinella umbellata]|nr:hypothetical protein BDC45DRAFT_529428 [Circinella umbellata]